MSEQDGVETPTVPRAERQPRTDPRRTDARRTGPRRGRDAVLALALPIACTALLLVVHPGGGRQDAATAPTTTALQTASIVCPSALAGTDLVGVSTLAAGPGGAAAGRVTVGLGQATTRSRVTTDRVRAVTPGVGPTVVTGAGDLAPGLVAGRSGSSPLAATDCPPVRGDQWFTGVGAGATHDSVLELVNPVSGDAEVDVAVWSSRGPVEIDGLRGVSVPGDTSTQLDLGQILPQRGSLALEVHVDRGQVASSVIDSEGQLAAGQVSRDWLPSQARTSTRNLLLGLAGGVGSRTLTLLNPGTDEARATLEVVTATGVFAPAEVDPIRVPADSTASVSLSGVLPDQVTQGAIGLLVTSSAPVAAGLRQVTGDDVSAVAPAASLTSSSAAVVPAGGKRLLLAGVISPGKAEVSWYAAGGAPLGGQAVDLEPDQGADLAVPDSAVLVSVDPGGTGVGASVLVTSDEGAAVVGLRDLQRTGLVPDVRPGLP